MVRRQSGLLWRRKMTDIAEWNWDSKIPSSLIFDQITEIRKWSTLSVYLGSSLCKFMAFDLPVGVTDLNEQKSVAQARMQQQLGLTPGEWIFTLDAITTPNKSIACAIRRDVIDQLKKIAAEKKWRLISLQPYVCNIWNTFQEKHAAIPQSALLTIEKDALTVIASASNFIGSISTLTYSGEDKIIEREIKRLSLSLGKDGEQQIYLAHAEKNHSFASISSSNLMSKKNYLKQSRYADFRDLLFSEEN